MIGRIVKEGAWLHVSHRNRFNDTGFAQRKPFRIRTVYRGKILRGAGNVAKDTRRGRGRREPPARTNQQPESNYQKVVSNGGCVVSGERKQSSARNNRKNTEIRTAAVTSHRHEGDSAGTRPLGCHLRRGGKTQEEVRRRLRVRRRGKALLATIIIFYLYLPARRSWTS